jgi:hypothetical protein
MVFDPVDFFCLAQWLCDTKPLSPSKSLVRTIINRAYYAALICVSEATKVSTKGGHFNVVTALRSSDPVAANKLDALRLLRQKADYTRGRIDPRSAEISLMESRYVLCAVKRAPLSLKTYDEDFLDYSCFIASKS